MGIFFLAYIFILFFLKSFSVDRPAQHLRQYLLKEVDVLYRTLKIRPIFSVVNCFVSVIVPAGIGDSVHLLQLLWALETQAGYEHETICLLIIPTNFESTSALVDLIMNGWNPSRAAIAKPLKVFPLVLHFPKTVYESSNSYFDYICLESVHKVFLEERTQIFNDFGVFDNRSPSDELNILENLNSSCTLMNYPLITLLKDVALHYILRDIPANQYIALTTTKSFYRPNYMAESIKWLQTWWFSESTDKWILSSIVLFSRIEDGSKMLSESKFSDVLSLSGGVIATEFLRNHTELTLLKSIPRKAISYHYSNVDNWFVKSAEVLGADIHYSDMPLYFQNN